MRRLQPIGGSETASVGDSAVGKSSVVLRFVSNSFEPNKEPTIGAAFLTQKCRLEDKVIKFEMRVARA